MISGASVTRRVGVVPGEKATEASARSIAQSLALLERLIGRHASPVEISPAKAAPNALPLDPGVSAYLLGHGVQGTAMLRELERPALVAAPFLTGGGPAQKTSRLLWAFEDSTQIRSSDPRKLEQWIETTCLSRSGIEAVVRAAESLASNSLSDRLYWVVGGYGDLEDFALAHARELASKLAIDTISIDQAASVLAQAGSSAPSTLLCVGRTAVPLCRILNAQGWVGWSERGFAVAQAWGDAGPALALSLLLDRMGLAAEVRDLEKCLWEALRDPSRPPGRSTVDHMIAMLDS